MDQRFGLLQSPMPQSYVIFMRKSASTGLRQQKRQNHVLYCKFFIFPSGVWKITKNIQVPKMEFFSLNKFRLFCGCFFLNLEPSGTQSRPYRKCFIQPAVLRCAIFIQVELQREAIGVLTLSKFLAEETLSSHMLLAARLASVFFLCVFCRGCGLGGFSGYLWETRHKTTKNPLLHHGGCCEHEWSFDQVHHWFLLWAWMKKHAMLKNPLITVRF